MRGVQSLDVKVITLFAESNAPGMWNPFVLCMLFGGIFLAAGLIGGGLKIKEIEIPKFDYRLRILTAALGAGLFAYGILNFPKAADETNGTNRLKSLGCSAVASLKTGSSINATTITFFNNSDTALKGFWIDSEGQKKPWFTLSPRGNENDHWKQSTYEGHPWMVGTEQGSCLAVFIAVTQDSVAFIDARR
jgi:hypothetical protein